ncbi:hypothetical protein [Brucella rhizosphaerae]|uniref:hypothetical protein n=1 Tax=Brucella rhizosphaerae TaxID=571254 RepID=UPI0012694241|nr:hypothetical protein [Brucella rhizosphaerae]
MKHKNSRDVLGDLDQAVDELEILWLALMCQTLHDANTVTRATSVLYSALELLRPVQNTIDQAGEGWKIGGAA